MHIHKNKCSISSYYTHSGPCRSLFNNKLTVSKILYPESKLKLVHACRPGITWMKTVMRCNREGKVYSANMDTHCRKARKLFKKCNLGLIMCKSW